MRFLNLIPAIATLQSLTAAESSNQKHLRGLGRETLDNLYQHPDSWHADRYSTPYVQRNNDEPGTVVLPRSPGQCLSCGRKFSQSSSTESKRSHRQSVEHQSHEFKSTERFSNGNKSNRKDSVQSPSRDQRPPEGVSQGKGLAGRKSIAEEPDGDQSVQGNVQAGTLFQGTPSPKSVSSEAKSQKSQTSFKGDITHEPQFRLPAPETHHVLELVMAHVRKKQTAVRKDLDGAKLLWDKGIAREDSMYWDNSTPHEKYMDWQHIWPELYDNPGREPRVAMGKLGKQIETIGSIDKEMHLRLHQKATRPLERPWWPPMPQSIDYEAQRQQRGKKVRIEAQKLHRSKSAHVLGGQKVEQPPRKKNWHYTHSCLSRTHSCAPEDLKEGYAKSYWHDDRREKMYGPTRWFSGSSDSD